MALADIQKKSAEERKREKRLVHMTNALARDYLLSKQIQKTKVDKENAEYIVKSMLDYLFFHERKEIQELQNRHVHDFMMVHAPNKLSLSAVAGAIAPETITSFLVFLQENGHIKNAGLLVEEVKTNKRAFLKLMPKTKKQTAPKKAAPRKKAKKPKIDMKVGRNDPCPCGSGKKYKKCCGQSK
jgi:preprotein translocase subunit SecA